MKENERIEIWIGFLDYGWPIESFAKHVVRCVCMEKELNKKTGANCLPSLRMQWEMWNGTKNMILQSVHFSVLDTCRCMCALYDADIKLRMASYSSLFFAIYLTGFGLVVA